MYIQEISQKLQLSKKAINLYEEKGLINHKKTIMVIVFI